MANENNHDDVTGENEENGVFYSFYFYQSKPNIVLLCIIHRKKHFKV